MTIPTPAMLRGRWVAVADHAVVREALSLQNQRDRAWSSFAKRMCQSHKMDYGTSTIMS